MGVIHGDSGLQEARTFTVPSNPGDFMIRGVWPHRRAVLPWTWERDLTGSSTCRVLDFTTVIRDPCLRVGSLELGPARGFLCM